ncbi:MAG: hypothetical protein PHO39_07740 [Fermentimonas sp.]|nr:hypothetical protein [Fermentimonas sp.]
MTIFFSWQSDLNLKSNKNFIEGCIKTAIGEFNKENKLLVDFTLDKDTSGEPGNPEIINTILNKIDNSRMFICDLSIINYDYHGRKTPNPNVIFELGYAIKSLGWEKIVCIVNQEFGLVEDLPFDIKHRRLIGYNLNSKDKQVEKKKIVAAIKSNLTILRDRGLLHDELEDYFKRDIDTEFLTITNHLRKIVLNESSSNLLSDTGLVFNLSKEMLKDNIANRDILGFHLFKNFELNAQSLKKQIDNIISVSNFKKEKLVALVKFKEWLDWYNAFTNGRKYSDLFIKGNEAVGFKTISSNNPKLPDRIILGKLLPNDKLMVADFGDIKLKDRVQHSTHLHQVNQKHLDDYSKLIFSFIEITNEWLDKTGGEFIVDTFNQFEMK